MLSLHRLGIYTGAALAATLVHSLLRLGFEETHTQWALGLATLYAFKAVEQRMRLGLKDRHSYYVPLGVVLLLLGEAAEAINAAVSLEPVHKVAVHRCAVQASLGFSVIAECEWWRDFHPSAYHEKLAMPDLDAITTHFPGGRWLNFFSSALFNIMSLMIWFTIFLSLGWLIAFALYQDGRGVPGLFFVNEKVTPGWFYFHILLCSPLMLVAKKIHGEIEARLLPRDGLSVREEDECQNATSGMLKKVDSTQDLRRSVEV